MEGKVDILLISETKIDASFPLNQFILKGYSTPFRADRNSQGGGLIMYVREDIPCKELKMSNIPGYFEAMFIELIIGRTKWFLMGGYNPKKGKIYYFLIHASKIIDKFIGNYENMIILGDLNVETSEVIMKDFCEMYNFRNLINKPTCYKNAKNPSCIDVILTNCPSCFNDSMTVETGLSDHHKMTLTVLKTFFKNKLPTIVNYRSYKNFDEHLFRNSLKNALQDTINIHINYDEFKEIFMLVLNKYAPMKKEHKRK